MTYNLRALPEIEEDALAAVRWYQQKSDILGDAFLTDFYESAIALSNFPYRYQMQHRAFRRCLLRTFPYALYYSVGGETVTLFGLFHSSRNPADIRTALTNRKIDAGIPDNEE